MGSLDRPSGRHGASRRPDDGLIHLGRRSVVRTRIVGDVRGVEPEGVGRTGAGFRVRRVVFQVLDVLQRVEHLVLDLPAAASRAG